MTRTRKNTSTQAKGKTATPYPQPSPTKKPSKGKEKYYAVYRGFDTGIFTSWYGEKGAREITEGCSGAKHKSFNSLNEATTYLLNLGMEKQDIKLHYGTKTLKYCEYETLSTSLRETLNIPPEDGQMKDDTINLLHNDDPMQKNFASKTTETPSDSININTVCTDPVATICLS